MTKCVYNYDLKSVPNQCVCKTGGPEPALIPRRLRAVDMIRVGIQW